MQYYSHVSTVRFHYIAIGFVQKKTWTGEKNLFVRGREREKKRWKVRKVRNKTYFNLE